MLVELTKVEMVDGSPTIGRIHVNPSHVVSIVEDNLAYHDLKEGLLKAGVHDQFSVSKMIVYEKRVFLREVHRWMLCQGDDKC